MLTPLFDALGLTGWTRLAVNVGIIWLCLTAAILIMWARLMDVCGRG